MSTVKEYWKLQLKLEQLERQVNFGDPIIEQLAAFDQAMAAALCRENQMDPNVFEICELPEETNLGKYSTAVMDQMLRWFDWFYRTYLTPVSTRSWLPPNYSIIATAAQATRPERPFLY